MTWPLLLSGLVVTVATMAQATTGIGFGILAGPLVLLVQPDFVPGPLLLLGLAVTTAVAVQDRAAVDLRPLRGALLASVPGAVGGLVVLRVIDDTVLALTVAGVVLVGCATAVLGVRLPSSPLALTGAGLLAGLLSTVAAVPGPPMALTYRAPSAAAQRANLSVFFIGTTVVSVVLLLAGHELSGGAVGQALSLLPFVVVGHLLAVPATRRLDLVVIRRLALGLCCLAGVALLTTTLATG